MAYRFGGRSLDSILLVLVKTRFSDRIMVAEHMCLCPSGFSSSFPKVTRIKSGDLTLMAWSHSDYFPKTSSVTPATEEEGVDHAREHSRKCTLGFGDADEPQKMAN